MPEPVRLVIWDLDGTFWNGTVTEGGHVYSESNHRIVVELANRGIVSSICSKNDLETVKAILVERGIWEYFVFPSVNWYPKGPRLKQLIEDIQLRPETVMLLDDNHLNLREAEYFVPGIQTADDSFIPQILTSPLFKGKNDRDLSRLSQYKLLETRKADEALAEDNTEFLRSCEIRVCIEHNVEKHIDRAIELINRTNQLNFTKNRLPEDPDQARTALRDTLRGYDVQAGLVHVSDRYGDYGYSGFYLVKTTRKGRVRVQHFCFSCRILNMGVEKWVHERLGSPKFQVIGDVLTNLSGGPSVDWINAGNPATTEVRQTGQDQSRSSGARVVLRGACTVSPLAHYFQLSSDNVIGEFHDVRDLVQVRRDHSLMLQLAIEGLTRNQVEILQELGFLESDFRTVFGDTTFEPTLRIVSNWADSQQIVFRHKATNLLVPYKFKKIDTSQKNKNMRVIRANPVDLEQDDENLHSLPPIARRGLQYLHRNFERVGVLPAEAANRAFDVILDAIPAGSPLFWITAPETGLGEDEVREHVVASNQRVIHAAERHKNKQVIPISISGMAKANERHTGVHFDRNVYFRLYESIWSQYRQIVDTAKLQEWNSSVTARKQPLSLQPVLTD